MSFWAILVFIIKWLPTAISIISAIIKAIREIKDPKERAQVTAELWQAVQKAKDTGNLTPIEEFKDRCGLRCRIDRRQAEREARKANRGG